MVMANLEEVHLDRRVEESLVGCCHGTGLDFLHGDDVLALRGQKKEEKLAVDTTMRRKKKRKVGGRT